MSITIVDGTESKGSSFSLEDRQQAHGTKLRKVTSTDHRPAPAQVAECPAAATTLAPSGDPAARGRRWLNIA